MSASETITLPADSAESRRYNRIKRWLGISDFAIGIGLLVVLLATGWTGSLRDLAYRGAMQNYTLAVFLYVTMLMVFVSLSTFMFFKASDEPSSPKTIAC